MPLPIPTMPSLLRRKKIQYASSIRHVCLVHLAYRPPQKEMQTRYSTHREARNAAQKEKLLAPDFAGVMVDPILLRLEDPSIEPGFVDTRNCLVFWARPPEKVKALVKACQEKLKDVVPSMLFDTQRHRRINPPCPFHADRCPRQTSGSCPRLLST